jgi:hypothetical protein
MQLSCTRLVILLCAAPFLHAATPTMDSAGPAMPTATDTANHAKTAAISTIEQQNSERAAITETITQGYFNGAFNALDTVAMARAFHADFAILGSDGAALDRYTLSEWIHAIEQRKAKKEFDPATAVRDCRIIDLNVTDNAAGAKVEIYQNGALRYVDYLLLIKFGTQWKIVSKVYADKGE